MIYYLEVSVERISMRETAWTIKAITNPITLLRLENLLSNGTHSGILSILHSTDQGFISMKALTKTGNLQAC